MPKRAQYTVSWSPERARYLLTGPEGEARDFSEDEESWLTWIEEHSAFAFRGRNGQINLLKEQRGRGGEGYWYAYQRRKGKMVKRYVGRGAQVSVERLEEIAALLAGEEKVEPVPALSERTGFEPLLMPKLQLPLLQKSLLPREHLLEELDKSLEHKVALISGPAGYGKTTLVSQWSAQRRAHADFPRVASVTLDEGDNDPIRFWRYIIAACQQLRAGCGKEALELLLAHRLPPFKSLDTMLVALLNDVSRFEHPGVLILDDLHIISSPQVIQTLSFFIDHLPTSFHLILLIRGEPPFPLTRLRARNELLDIYPPQLAFSPAETRAFFERELDFAFSPESLRRINERLEGWPTGLRLLARTLHWPENEQEIEHMLAAFAGSHWSLRDYFLSEVLHALPEEQQQFLLQTCILPRITASLCNTVTGREDSAQLINALHTGDLFLVPLDSRGEWARYYPLFAEAMQQEARRRLGDERLHQLAALASLWYEEHGYLAEAIETALDASEFARAANLIKRFSESKQQYNTFSMPELYTLNRWLERLPEEELERSADLCVLYAMAMLFLVMQDSRFSDERARRIHHLLQIAEQHWRDANNTAKLAEIFSFQALLARQEGNLLQAITWAKQALAWLPPEERTWRNLALTDLGIGELLEGSLENARGFLLEALKLSEQQNNLTYARAARGMLSGVSIEQGELRHADEALRQMQAEARAQEDPDDIARTQLALARIAYQWNKLEEAHQAASEALALGEEMNMEESQALATIHLALIEHALGQSAQAQQRLTAWLARGHTPTTLASYQLARAVEAALARIQLVDGNLVAVERWFASTEQRVEVLPLLQRQREQLLRARLLLAQGASAVAIERLESIAVAALRTGHIYLRLEALVILALAYARQGAPEEARRLLRELLATARGEGYLRLFLDEGEELAALLRGFLPHLREKTLLTYARHILSAFAQESDMPNSEALPNTALLQEPLSPQEQRVLRLLAAGNANAEIARELVVSVNTVRTQLQSIYRKLNVNNRVEASALARQLDLI